MVRNALLVLAALAVVAADGPPPGWPTAERYPQPVQVGDLMGRAMLQPVEAQPVLGEYVALVDLTPAQLDALPTAAPGVALPSDTTIRMGLVWPFH